MLVEPRTVEPDSLKRWLKQSSELLLRSFHTWFATSLVLCALMTLLSQWTLGLLVGGLASVCVSTRLAQLSDESSLTLAALLSALKESLSDSVQMLWERRYTLLASLVVGWLFVKFIGLLPLPKASPPPAPADLSDPLTWLIGGASPLMVLAPGIWFGSMVQAVGMGFNGLAYPLQKKFGTDLRTTQNLLFRAVQKNQLAAMQLEMGGLVGMMVCMALLPALAPVYLCYIGAMNYVAYRDVFEHGNGNTAEARQAQKATVAAASGAAA